MQLLATISNMIMITFTFALDFFCNNKQKYYSNIFFLLHLFSIKRQIRKSLALVNYHHHHQPISLHDVISDKVTVEYIFVNVVGIMVHSRRHFCLHDITIVRHTQTTNLIIWFVVLHLTHVVLEIFINIVTENFVCKLKLT